MKTKKSTTVMVFGTFDVVHKGHEFFLKQAKKLGGKNARLVVSIARDTNVKKIKGRAPWYSEKVRAAHLKKLGIANKVVLGDKKNYIQHIKKAAPDLIVLGYDQKAYTKTLRKDLKAVGLNCRVIRLRAHKPHLYKSSKIKAKMLSLS